MGDTVAVDPFKQHLDVNDLRYSPGTTVNGSLNLLGLEDGFSSLPMEFRLKQNYPNPFNPETNIDFNLPVKSDIRLEIYNVLGHRINTLVNKQVSAGSHRIKWDGRDFLGRTVSAGVYFYKPNKYYISVSVPNILNGVHLDANGTKIGSESEHLFAAAGYVFDLSENFR